MVNNRTRRIRATHEAEADLSPACRLHGQLQRSAQRESRVSRVLFDFPYKVHFTPGLLFEADYLQPVLEQQAMFIQRARLETTPFGQVDDQVSVLQVDLCGLVVESRVGADVVGRNRLRRVPRNSSILQQALLRCPRTRRE